MKNKKKKKFNNSNNIASLKKDLLSPKKFANKCTSTTSINNQSKTHSSKLSCKIEILNNINTEDEENGQEILEKLFKEELNKFKIIEAKKNKLKNINLIEENANDLYNWNSLLNRKIPFEKRNEYNQKMQKKKFSSFNKIDYNSIDYTKGMNILSQIPNEALLNFYKNIFKYRKNVPELRPRIKLKHKNNVSNLKRSEKISLSDKEKYLNYLTLNGKENNDFSEHDLKITAKRKTAEVLIKAIILNNNNNNKKIEISKNDNNSKNNIKENKKMNKKKGLILSLYDENNPDIIKFNEVIYSLSEKNKNKNKIEKDVFGDLNGNTNSKIHGNFFSAKTLKTKNLSNNFSQDKEDFKNFSSGTTNESNYVNAQNNKRNKINFFKDKNNIKKRNFSVQLYLNKSIKSVLFRPLSSSNLLYSNNDKLNNNLNKKALSYGDYDETGFMNFFPRKKSSKVGNNIYDKINKILKFRYIKKFKLNEKKYSKNLITKAINSKYNKNEEESKNNKLIQTFLKENLRTSISKTTDNDILNTISKYKENERSSSKKENQNNLNKKIDNFFSCSNNYIVNIKRRQKQKFLSEHNDKDYLNGMFNEIIFEDKLTQKESTKRIKSLYNHNE